jgi:integrase
MPTWAGKWEGGRYYLDEQGRPVYFIERRVNGQVAQIKLPTSEETEAIGMLALFNKDRTRFVKSLEPVKETRPDSVFVTVDRVNLYMQSIRDCVDDHRAARKKYLSDWGEKGIDLMTVDRAQLRKLLASWEGGHRGRVEALNAFANFLVKEDELPTWKRFANPFEPKQTRAARVIYSLEQLQEKLKTLEPGPVRDLFYLRAATGMHQTEIDQIEKAKIYTGPLPDKGVGIRTLGDEHVIRGVVQVVHKNGQRHRVSVDQVALDAVMRLRAGVPSRVGVWKKLQPEIIPSNLRHTFATLMGEIGEEVHYKSGGVSRSIVAQFMGHRAGSTMLADRYENMQVPPMARLPLDK